MIKNTIIMIETGYCCRLAHTRERTDTFLFWWGYGGILRLLVGEWWVVGLEGEEENYVEGK